MDNNSSTVVRTSVNTKGPNHKVLWTLLITIFSIVAISVVYIIIFPNL